MQSALDLFYQKGYSKTTFDEIASRIELTKGAVYWHFKNKPDLVAALINDYVEKKNEYLQQKVPMLNQFKDIETYFLATADFILGDENALKLAFFLSLQMEWSETIITKASDTSLRPTPALCLVPRFLPILLLSVSGRTQLAAYALIPLIMTAPSCRGDPS